MKEKISLFDLHCDTLGVMYRMPERPFTGTLQADIRKCASVFEKYSQVFAVYSPDSFTPEESWNNFIHSCKRIRTHIFPDNVVPYLAVEGGKLLNGKKERLQIIKDCGVSVLTLVWGGHCCIGGAHNTNEGFTEFGEYTLRFCLENGIIPDVSHASDKMFARTAELCAQYGKPFIASHSCSRSICRHTRNLTDEMFRTIAQSGGIVGVSLAPNHLREDGNTAVPDVVRHISHYLSLGYAGAVALGCDYDGIDRPPVGLEKAEYLPRLYEALLDAGISEDNAELVFSKNAERFFERAGVYPIR